MLAPSSSPYDPNRTLEGLLALAGGENRDVLGRTGRDCLSFIDRGKRIQAALMRVHAEGTLDGAILDAGAWR